MSQKREFEQYLEGNADLSALYAELPQVTLPKHLDAAILAEAHRAVDSRPGAKSKRRWTTPLGLVASLIVAVLVGVQLPHMLKDSATPKQFNEEKIVAQENINLDLLPPPAEVERKTGQETVRAESEIADSKALTLAVEPAPSAKKMTPMLPSPKLSVNKLDASEFTEVETVASKLFNSPPIAASHETAKAVKRLELNERADVAGEMSLTKVKKPVVNTQGSVPDTFKESAQAGVASPQPVILQRSVPIVVEEGEINLKPEDWLNRIKQLKQAGRVEEVKKELVAFKKHYPDYKIPKDFEFDPQK